MRMRRGTISPMRAHPEAPATADAPVLAPDETRPRNRLRTIAYNVHQCTGFPPEAAAAVYGHVPGTALIERFAEALAGERAEIVTLSECPDEGATAAIAEGLGMRYVHFDSPEQWPGALFTRLDVLEAANCPLLKPRPEGLFTRHYGRAVLRLPGGLGGGEVAVHSAHLHPTDDARREREVTLLLDVIRRDLTAGLAVLLQGDLNHRPDQPEYQRWMGAELIDCFARAGGGMDYGYTFRADQPMARLDYVFAGGSLAGMLRSSGPLSGPPFTASATGDGEVGEGGADGAYALSDHLPQTALFQAQVLA